MGTRHVTPTAATATATKRSTFLSLPPHVRRLVYLHVGVAAQSGRRPYTFDLHGRKACTAAARPGTFSGLLLCCRSIYVEAATLLYSANHFIIHYSSPGSLAPLLALTTLPRRALTSLKIVLNQASCHHRKSFRTNGSCCHENEEGSVTQNQCGHAHQMPLLGSNPNSHGEPLEAARVLLREWHSAAVHLSTSIDSGRLNLFLVCDINSHHEQGPEIARLATAPIGLLPLLKDCHVRLCKVPNRNLQRVAHDAVMGARRITLPYSTPPSTSRLMQLPRELRLYILEHTDLVTPWMEVSWGTHERYTVEHAERTKHESFKQWPSIYHGCQFTQCWLKDGRRDIPFVGCFCRRRHAAFSSACQCWVPPGPNLFLVCRAMCADARLVFFSRNRFIIHDYLARTPLTPPDPTAPHLVPSMRQCSYPYNRLAASLFLGGHGNIIGAVPASCLGHLRFLELVFPPYSWSAWPPPDHPAMRDWRETVAFLRSRMNLPALTVRLITTGNVDSSPEDDETELTDEQGNEILASYKAIMDPLKQWADVMPEGQGEDGGGGGLARFYADLACPWTETTAERSMEPDGDDFLVRQNRARKKEAERAVMGARYESQYAGGKREPIQSIWYGVWYAGYAMWSWSY